MQTHCISVYVVNVEKLEYKDMWNFILVTGKIAKKLGETKCKEGAVRLIKTVSQMGWGVYLPLGLSIL